jgi:D-arabinose 1-dehydrogenase-like Zn-dependent alcohol dehydrogenase
LAVPREAKAEAYAAMAAHAAAGELRVEIRQFPLEQVREAWQALAAGSHRKIMLVP